MPNDRLLAAGGLLWEDASRTRIAIVHRHRHDDFCLPKGKLRDDESFEAAALREVEEETGCRPCLEEFAGELYYRADGRPKSVLFWNMTRRSPEEVGPIDAEEVAEVLWLDVDEALARMSYESEKGILRQSRLDPLPRQNHP